MKTEMPESLKELEKIQEDPKNLELKVKVVSECMLHGFTDENTQACLFSIMDFDPSNSFSYDQLYTLFDNLMYKTKSDREKEVYSSIIRCVVANGVDNDVYSEGAEQFIPGG